MQRAKHLATYAIRRASPRIQNKTSKELNRTKQIITDQVTSIKEEFKKKGGRFKLALKNEKVKGAQTILSNNSTGEYS